MKVLHLISSAGYYGAENMLVTLGKALERTGADCTVGIFRNSHRPNLEVADRARQAGLKTVLIPCVGRLDSGALRAIEQSVVTGQIDVIHAHGYKANVYGHRVARKKQLPAIATCHNWPGTPWELRFYYHVLDRLALRSFDHVVAVSEAVRDSLRLFGMPGRKISVIYNGVDVSQYGQPGIDSASRRQSDGPINIGYVGRLDMQKGLDPLLLAVAPLLRERPELKLTLIGDGPAREQLRALANQLRVEDKVIFAGQRQDMPAVYASLDLFVLPSLREGMPMTVLEALAAGRPVIATDVGAIPKVVINGETGLLVKAGDVDGLRNAILKLLSDASLAARLAKNGRAHVTRFFSADTMAQAYMGVYRQMLANPRSSIAKTSKVAVANE